MAHVFEINDGGEVFWWAADTHDDAIREHVEYHRSCGVPDCDIQPDTPIVQPGNRWLVIDGVKKQCDQWAAETAGSPVPMVGTTAV